MPAMPDAMSSTSSSPGALSLGEAGLKSPGGTGGKGAKAGSGGEGRGRGGEGTKDERMWKRLWTVEVRGEFCILAVKNPGGHNRP